MRERHARTNLRCWSKLQDLSRPALRVKDVSVQLLEPDIGGVLTETLSAQVQVVFPDQSMTVTACLAFPGPSSVLPWSGEPNIIVTHPGAVLVRAISLVEVNQAIKAWSLVHDRY